MFYQPWIAFWFCAFISAMAVISDLGQSFLNHQPAQLGMLTGFLAFLPMCFYFMGLMVSRQQVELNDLRGQIAALKAKSEA
jgi:hypothetical protein